MTEKIVTRFAPSPTGFMHVGSLRTALYAYLFAKQNNGVFILRIEDTDKEREVEGSKEHIMDSLRYVLSVDKENIDPWTYGPNKKNPFGSAVQSERLDIYNEYAKALLESGFAYVDNSTPEDIENLKNDAIESKKPFLFRLHRKESTASSWDGKTPLRFKVSDIEKTTWRDEVRGELTAGEEALDDFIIMKSDGFPTYNFCHVVDDIEMGVTHVMRGEEFIASTPKFIALYKALQKAMPEKNISIPKFITLPPILGEEGNKKLSKRDGAKDILDYQKEGFLPDALANFLALQGWNPGGTEEIFTLEDLIKIFSIEKIQKSGARWNETKLAWINKEHIKKMSSQDRFEKIQNFIPKEILSSTNFSKEKLLMASDVIIEKINHFAQIEELFKEGEFIYLFEAPKDYPKEIVFWKGDISVEGTKNALNSIIGILENNNEETINSPERVKSLLWGLSEQLGRGNVLWPLRVALTGKDKSIDPFTVVSIVGKEETISRINFAIKKISV